MNVHFKEQASLQVNAILIVNDPIPEGHEVCESRPEEGRICFATAEVFGQSPVARVAERLRLSGAHITLIGNPRGQGLTHGRGIDTVVARDANERQIATAHAIKKYAKRTSGIVLIARLGAYVELDLEDALRAHKASEPAITSIHDENGCVQYWLIDTEKLKTIEVWPFLLEAGTHRALPDSIFRTRGYVNRMASAYDLRKLVVDGFLGRCSIRPRGQEIRPGIWVDDGTRLDKSARLVAPTYLGSHTTIEPAAVVSRFSNIERSCHIGEGSLVTNSSVLPNTIIGQGLDVSSAVASGSEFIDLKRNVALTIADPNLIARWRSNTRHASPLDILRHFQAQDPHVVVVDLSRNWGHMGALHAGLQTARGDAVVLMDGDLQDPPEVISKMVNAWRGGAQVVTAVRRTRKEKRKVLAVLFPLFYRVFGAISDYPIPLNAGIFGLLDRQVLDSLNNLREGNRYLPGLRAWVGYRTVTVYYDRQERVGGEGKLSFMSRIKYAIDAITSFSYKPLRLSFALALTVFVMGLVSGAIALISRSNPMVYGLFFAICLMSSLPLFCIGVMGEYLGRVYDEVRARPLSIINRVYNSEQLFVSTGLSAVARVRSVDGGEAEAVFPAA